MAVKTQWLYLPKITVNNNKLILKTLQKSMKMSTINAFKIRNNRSLMLQDLNLNEISI